ncbi:MAG: MFS transporter [Flavobacteriales bacterium]|nr:MAG: MFS transporter [Flavobacteriales bacterium]
MIQKGDKKIIKGWVMYDWANSVYSLVISTAIFPIFYEAQTTATYLNETGLTAKEIESNDVTIDFFGYNVSPSVLYSLVISVSFLLVSFISPILSGIADYTGNKKRFLQFFCYFGSLSCMSLFFFDANYMEFSMISVLCASIGFWCSLVFYNAFLPEIAPLEEQDDISARGFIMGYIGSIILLLICLGLIMGYGPHLTKYCFILVGLWWIGFAQITYRVIPNNPFRKKPEADYIWKGFRELKIVYKEFMQTTRLKKYLYAFFFFNSGVQTVMLLATIFASKAIEWPEDEGTTGLIIAILLIQILAAIGAKLMSNISIKIGNISTLKISVFIWILLCFGAYFITTPTEFYILASFVGLVMGGIQSIARSTYSKYLPETTDHASYFSFYDVSEKLGIVLGTAFFAFTEWRFDDIRYSVISIGLFFIIGLFYLFRVPKEEKIITS